MQIGITAPIYITHPEHIRYLNLTTKSLVSSEHDLFFIPVENYIAPDFRPLSYSFDHEPEEIIITQGRQPQSVAAAWNEGLTVAMEKELDYCLVINTDIVLKSNAIDRLVAFAIDHSEALLWTMSEWSDLASIEEAPEDEGFNEHPHFSCYMVSPVDFIAEMGGFDENFIPAYVEDGDMHARMAHLNQKAYIYGGAKFYHFGSRNIKSDPREWDKNTQTFPRNQEYFLRKWGHPPVNEVAKMREVYFKHPFNDSSMDVNDWKEPSGN